MKNSLRFRWMEPADAERVGILARQIWNAHYPSIVSQAQIDYMLADRYSPSSLAAQMKDGQRFLLVEKTDILGFLSISPLADIENPLLRGTEPPAAQDFFLHKFYILPEYHGRGIGKAMLGELDRQMPEIRRLRLQVNRRNENSWQFYLKQGFAIVTEADFDIGGGFKMEDYVMERKRRAASVTRGA